MKQSSAYEPHPTATNLERLYTFDRVLVRNFNTECWMPQIFVGQLDAIRCTDDYLYHTADGYFSRQCLPYAGHEHLAFTTDAPAPKHWEPGQNDDYYHVMWHGRETPLVVCDTWTDANIDRGRREIGNCFRSRAEAELKAEELRQAISKIFNNPIKQ